MPTATATDKFLTFKLNKEGYAIDVMQVVEIIRLQKITPVPQMPPFVKGVINLRGRVIPVVDLRLKFGLEAVLAERTCIVVVQVKLPDGKATQMGLVVDGVEEVFNIAATDIEETPDFGGQIAADYIVGGLGFPIVNDEVLVPAFLRHGRSLEDARDYICSCCYENTIPGREAFHPNGCNLNLPFVLNWR